MAAPHAQSSRRSGRPSADDPSRPARACSNCVRNSLIWRNLARWRARMRPFAVITPMAMRKGSGAIGGQRHGRLVVVRQRWRRQGFGALLPANLRASFAAELHHATFPALFQHQRAQAQGEMLPQTRLGFINAQVHRMVAAGIGVDELPAALAAQLDGPCVQLPPFTVAAGAPPQAQPERLTRAQARPEKIRIRQILP